MYNIYIFIYLLHFFNNLYNLHLFLIFKYLSTEEFIIKNHWNLIKNEIVKHFWHVFSIREIVKQFSKRKKKKR